MPRSPALKLNGTDYLVSEDRQPVHWPWTWVRRLVEWIGGL